MKRSIIGLLACVVIVSGFVACSGKPSKACDPDYLTPKPQFCADRDSIGFAQEFGSGTLIGTHPDQTIMVRNGGLENLTVESAAVTGDPEFKFTYSPALPASVPGNQNFFVRIEFTPALAKRYQAKLTLKTNAENFPTKEINISGCGVPADGGPSPCYRDAGI
jgi:hypothetical protein